jgi:hypothetical protein
LGRFEGLAFGAGRLLVPVFPSGLFSCGRLAAAAGLLAFLTLAVLLVTAGAKAAFRLSSAEAPVFIRLDFSVLARPLAFLLFGIEEYLSQFGIESYCGLLDYFQVSGAGLGLRL